VWLGISGYWTTSLGRLNSENGGHKSARTSPLAAFVVKGYSNKRQGGSMKVSIARAAFAALVCGSASISHAALPLTINPTSDGSLYTCSGCNVVSDGAYVLASGYIQGAVKFSSAPITGPVTQAVLTLNPYGLPLWGTNVDVYGYGTTIGQLDVTDANAGTFLGTLVLPSNLGYGQDAFFDVTAFVANTTAPFLAFNLRTTGTDVFSSMEYNYGHPSQLLVTTAAVPEPTQAALLAAGLFAVYGLSRRRLTPPRTPRQTAP
ncbi:PEP-CTERM sorting domain-containing protein, partial [Paucibacter sp. DJ1R-11]|uniref:PEP-CTERM sorting domain-containing protein n=1 Tax=Paucibacter sp. DJ1R-11 TaxID=2893556 RepID=UPI0021E44948